MSLLATFFRGDPSWKWRRLMAFSGCAVFLSGVAKAIWLPGGDIAYDSMVMTNCVTGFGATMALYAGLAVADDKFKRENDTERAKT